MEEMITSNVTALTRLTYAVAPGFLTRGAGTIINIFYGGTKAFVVAFSYKLPSASRADHKGAHHESASQAEQSG